MRNGKDQIGFSQRVRLEWLEQTANLVLAGCEKSEIEARLQELLRDKVSVGGDAERGNREKIISILMKVWAHPPRDLDPLRLTGLELLGSLPRGERMAIHWGMVTAVYPFWGSVATQVGRLLRLQESITAPQIQRRIREQYGERETVFRAARRILRCFLDWGVLGETGGAGTYAQGLVADVERPEVISWLIEACLRGRRNGSAAGLADLMESASLFPFHLKRAGAQRAVAASSGLELHRHGMDEDLVVLRAHRPASAGAG